MGLTCAQVLTLTRSTLHLWGFSKDFKHLSRLTLIPSDGTCLNCHPKKDDNFHVLLKCPAIAAQRTEIFAYRSQLMPQIKNKIKNP